MSRARTTVGIVVAIGLIIAAIFWETPIAGFIFNWKENNVVDELYLSSLRENVVDKGLKGIFSLEAPRALADGGSDAMMVYDTMDITSTPKYRLWSGSSWGSEALATDVSGEIRHMVVKYAPDADEAIMVVLTTTGEIQAQVFDGTGWGSVTALGITNNANGSRENGSLYRQFDIEYEQSSGDAVVVYSDGTADLNYQVWNGSGWSGETNIDIPSTGRPYWVEMASRPGSDELAFISLDSNIDVYGMRWTGSTWDAMGASAVWDDAAAIATEKCIDVAFEKTSGDIMFVWGDATSTDNYYRTYSASTLSANTLLDQSTAGGVANWIRLASDPTAGSDQIMVGILDGGSDLNTAMWSGAGWGSFTEHSAGVENHVNLVFDIIFETHSSNANDAWLVWGNGSAVSRRLWNGSGTPAWQTATTSGDDTGYIRLNAHPNSGAVFALLEEDVSSANDDITTLQLTGGSQTWSSVSTVWVGPVPRALSLSKIDIASERFVAPISNQSAYRFFNNTDSTDVGTALAIQDIAANLGAAGAAFRLRMLLHVSSNQLIVSGQDFKLQFVGKGAGTCSSPSGGTPASYTDVSTSTAIAFNDNATPADGDALTANDNDPIHNSDTRVNQTYEELNNFTNSIAAIPSGQDGKWDFSLIDNNNPATSATYCFRVAKLNDSVLDYYDVYPEITTSAVTQSLTLTVDPLSLDVGILVPNNPTSATSTAAVYVNGVSSGYNLQIKRDDASSTLDLTTDSGINFPDLTPWDSSGNGNATTSLGANLSFRIRQLGTDANYSSTWWGANDSNGTAKYAGLPADSQQIINCNSGSACNNGTTTSVILYRLDAPINQPVGSYDGMITFTALVNP